MSRILMLACLSAVILIGCATSTRDSISVNSCQSETLTIDAEFERGAFAACKLTGAYAAMLVIRPELRTTNNSAWYAFRVQTDTPAPVTIMLYYKDGSHRYWPKTSSDGDQWIKVSPQDVRISKSRDKAVFEVDTNDAPLFVAAQPLNTLEGAIERIDGFLSTAGFTPRTVGVSGEGRQIRTYENAPSEAKRLVVLLARQHPPETTGAVAFEAFIARLAEADSAATRFRENTKIFIAPMVNPDGFVNGHWRGNAQGFDLNRDWGPFETPEISALSRRILELANDTPPAFFVDFHSTQRNVIYAAPLEMTSGDMTNVFLDKFARRLGVAAPEISRSHKSENMTSKAWSLDVLGVAGFTYEVADDADLDEVAAIARSAAEALLETMSDSQGKK